MESIKIHKGNYEEYFLLYVDNELSASEKEMVEEFAEAYPELKAELQLLLDTTLPAETIPFIQKDSLLKNESISIEELQLLMIDDELDAFQKDALVRFHQSNPESLAEFECLKKTKLSEEKIIYPLKNKLYKRSATVVFMRRFAPLAAAAMLIAVLLINNIPQTNDGSSPGKIIAVVDTPVTKEEPARITENAVVDVTEEKVSEEPIKEFVSDKHSVLPTDETSESEQEQPMAIIEKNDETLSMPVVEASAPLIRIAETTVSDTDDYIQQSLSQTTVEEEAEQPKKGLRGIVRKASRIYTKITQPEGDKPLIKLARYEIGFK